MTLEELHERQRKELERQKTLKRRIHCCTAAGCMSCGAEAVKKSITDAVEQSGASDIEVRGTGCMGLCSCGPLVQTSDRGETAEGEASQDDTALYGQIAPDDAAQLVKQDSEAKESLAGKRLDTELPFFKQQQRVVLENSGRVDPERIDDYIAVGGYASLGRIITEMKPTEVIAEIKASGLRGRGGAGYPTGLKWELVAKNPAGTKYVVCNADEGDPGAFMDRSVLEGDPHRVLEGMAIAGYAVGAQQGYVYVRGEYALAIERLRKAIRQAERHGLLGNRIFDSAFQFRVDIRIGAGAFVCGEETALLASIEGRRGEPRPRPPYPPEKGLWGKPTLINNVETFANIVPIIREGGEWFASIGTERSKGTKVFAVAGKVKNTGLIEVPMGMPLRTLVNDIAGGVPDGGTLKAVQTGGPSGGCIPEQLLDVAVDYESLAKTGSIMGSGGLIVIDDETSMVDVARFFMEFCKDESCGKCIPCRAGTVQIHDILDRLGRKEARRSDIELLKELADLLQQASLCGLGQTAPNPVLSALRYFPDEFERQLPDEANEEGRS